VDIDPEEASNLVDTLVVPSDIQALAVASSLVDIGLEEASCLVDTEVDISHIAFDHPFKILAVDRDVLQRQQLPQQ